MSLYWYMFIHMYVHAYFLSCGNSKYPVCSVELLLLYKQMSSAGSQVSSLTFF